MKTYYPLLYVILFQKYLKHNEGKQKQCLGYKLMWD
jgi:hypothetical protein